MLLRQICGLTASDLVSLVAAAGLAKIIENFRGRLIVVRSSGSDESLRLCDPGSEGLRQHGRALLRIGRVPSPAEPALQGRTGWETRPTSNKYALPSPAFAGCRLAGAYDPTSL